MVKALQENEKKLVTSISPFPTMFIYLPKENFSFLVIFGLSSANALNLNQSKIFCLEKS